VNVEYEDAPVSRVPSFASARFTNGVALSAAQGCGRVLAGERPAVEQLHEIHRGAIIDRPDGEQEISSTDIVARTPKPHDTFADRKVSQGSLAS
jgi:hypothetical protein